MDKNSRTKLLEAAIPLFAKKGFAAVSIREVAQAAGINSALITYYFGSKEGLYTEIFESQFPRIVKALQVFNDPSLDSIKKVKSFIQTLTATHVQFPYLRRLMNSELSNPTPVFEKIVHKYIAEVYKSVHQTIVEGVAKGQFRADLNPSFITIALVGMIQFYFLASPIVNELVPPDSERDSHYCQQTLEIFFDGIGKKPD